MSNLANMTVVLDDDDFDTAEAANAAEAKPMRPDRALARALLWGRTKAMRASRGETQSSMGLRRAVNDHKKLAL